MKHVIVVMAVALLLLSAGIVAGQEEIGTVVSEDSTVDYDPGQDRQSEPAGQVKTMTLPVVHDTTMRTDADLTARERHFLSTVPNSDGLRDAIREMVLANVVHVPKSECGNYRPGDSVRYWGIYQSWTGPHKVRIPVIRGPRGLQGSPGLEGREGPMGPQGPQGQGVVNNTTNVTYNCAQQMYGSSQLGGGYAPVVTSTQLVSVNFVPSTNISLTANATGGSVGPITNNNSNANSNTNVNVNTINVGSGAASGKGTGSSGSTAKSGSK